MLQPKMSVLDPISAKAIYFAIITMTTVGFGDIAPVTTGCLGGIVFMTLIQHPHAFWVSQLSVSIYPWCTVSPTSDMTSKIALDFQ